MTDPNIFPEVSSYDVTQATFAQHAQDILLHDFSIPSNAQNAFYNNENRLVRASAMLLSLILALKDAQLPADPEQLRIKIMRELQRFKTQLEDFQYDPTLILTAEYCLCAALDEAALNTPWARKSDWGVNSLLSLRYNEALGGEKFFVILDKLIHHHSHLHLLELLYVIISLGFTGRYFNQEKTVIQSVRYQLYQKIAALRPPYPLQKTLATSSFKQRFLKALLRPYNLSLKAIFLLGGAVILFAYLIFEYKTAGLIQPLRDDLDTIRYSNLENF